MNRREFLVGAAALCGAAARGREPVQALAGVPELLDRRFPRATETPWINDLESPFSTTTSSTPPSA